MEQIPNVGKRCERMQNQLDEKIKKARYFLDEAEYLIIGAGAGLSAAAGLDFGGQRFLQHMEEFGQKYGYHNMYEGDFYPYETREEYWAFEAKVILLNRYDTEGLPLYKKILNMVEDKNYFVITTNVESQFVKSGFPEDKVFATQGDYSLFQCSKGCHKKLYNNETLVREMVSTTKDLKIPPDLIPKCPVCGKEMKPNLRGDQYFIEDEAWDKSMQRYQNFLQQTIQKNVVYLEFGVGFNTPGIIRYPFEQQTYENPKAHLIRFNKDYPEGAKENKNKTIGFTEDIAGVLDRIDSERRSLYE